MKKRFSSFLAGFFAAVLVISLGLTVLAASDTVAFNTVGLTCNGTQIAQPGDTYTLDNGQQVPNVIVYTDAAGGGTTYLPTRRIAELMGVTVGWEAASESVTIGSTPAPVATPAPAPSPQVTTTVYVTNTGTKYHRAGCQYLRQSQIAIALSDAKSQAYSACSVCKAPR